MAEAVVHETNMENQCAELFGSDFVQRIYRMVTIACSTGFTPLWGVLLAACVCARECFACSAGGHGPSVGLDPQFARRRMEVLQGIYVECRF